MALQKLRKLTAEHPETIPQVVAFITQIRAQREARQQGICMRTRACIRTYLNLSYVRNA